MRNGYGKPSGYASRSAGTERSRNYRKAHDALRDQILVALSKERLGVFWANETGMAFRDDAPVHYGLVGSSDIIGCLGDGRFVGIEVKTGNAQLSDQQRKWRARIQVCCGIVIEARSVEQVVAELKEAVCRN